MPRFLRLIRRWCSCEADGKRNTMRTRPPTTRSQHGPTTVASQASIPLSRQSRYLASRILRRVAELRRAASVLRRAVACRSGSRCPLACRSLFRPKPLWTHESFFSLIWNWPCGGICRCLPSMTNSQPPRNDYLCARDFYLGNVLTSPRDMVMLFLSENALEPVTLFRVSKDVTFWNKALHFVPDMIEVSPCRPANTGLPSISRRMNLPSWRDWPTGTMFH
jgi:hypothetical protein